MTSTVFESLVPRIAPAGVRTASAAELASTLSVSRRPLVLAPSDRTGWFEGTELVCWDPVVEIADASCSEAAAVLESAFNSDTPVVAVAQIAYQGRATIRVYRSGMVRDAGTWHLWGASEESCAPANHPHSRSLKEPLLLDPRAGIDRAEYQRLVCEVQERIAAGDVYVLNLSYRVTGTPAADSTETFRTLLDRAPASMAALFADPHDWIASVSPERFVRVYAHEDGSRHAEIWPIKGTRPRGENAATDRAFIDELLGSEKERAEHVMVVDLERNDLGVVSVAGSVHVDPLFEIATTTYCHQMISRVKSTLRPDASFDELLNATFPCGSVTGAPKRAAMRIIGELEHSAREAYTGALLVATPGHMDSSVLIRTLECQGDRACWGTGCGITSDSDPAEEWEESRLKLWPTTGR